MNGVIIINNNNSKKCQERIKRHTETLETRATPIERIEIKENDDTLHSREEIAIGE